MRDVSVGHQVKSTALIQEITLQPAQHRILCIDNRASSNLAVYLLERTGYGVKTASSIAGGIELAQVEHFDLHLLNHNLLDGLEIDSCDKLHGFAHRTPLLFYSTVSYPYQQIQAIHCRLHSHMLEPVNVCEVVDHVSRLLKTRTGAVDGILPRGTEIKTAVRANTDVATR